MGHRLLKVNEALREVLSQEIAALKDPRIGFVTVTGVEASADLRHAKVFVSVLGNATARERTLAGLRAAHGHLQAAHRRRRAHQAHAATAVPLRRVRSTAASASRPCSNATKASSAPSDEARPEGGGGELAPATSLQARPRPATTPPTPRPTSRESHDDRRAQSSRPCAPPCAASRRWPSPCTKAPTATPWGPPPACSTCSRSSASRRRLYVDAGVELPLADEFLPAERVVVGAPPEAATLYALDCGSRERLALTLGERRGRTIDIDHHHDNTRFGDLNLVVGDASSTSELVCDLAERLGLRFSPRAAAALYAGISFDTGHFQHSSTSASTFACCAPARGRRRRPEPPLQAALRDAHAGLAAPVGAGHRRRAGRGRRPRPAGAAHQRRLRARPAPTTTTPKASSKPCAACRASRSPPCCGRAAPTRCG